MSESEASTVGVPQKMRISGGQELRLWGIPLVALLAGLSFLWKQNERIIIVETNQALIAQTMDEVKDAMRDQQRAIEAHEDGPPHRSAATQEDILRIHSELVLMRQELRERPAAPMRN